MSEDKSTWASHNLPDEVQKLFDKAAEVPEHLAVVFTKDSVQLTLSDGKTILEEVKWAGVNEFAKVFLANVLGHTLENEKPPETIKRD